MMRLLYDVWNIIVETDIEVLEKEYIQPSYHKREDACPLWIMGNENSDFLPQYIERIKDEVYRRNISE